MKTEQEIANEIDTALHRWRSALKLVKSGSARMDCDKRDLQKRLMELDDIVAKYDFSGLPIIAAAVERAHRGMMKSGEAA